MPFFLVPCRIRTESDRWPEARRQILCSGCRILLLYPNGAKSVRCGVCEKVTSAPPSGAPMSQLKCLGCSSVLMYIREANTVQCPHCRTVTRASLENQVAHVDCQNCSTALMYPRTAKSVKCGICDYVTPEPAEGVPEKRAICF